MEFDKGTTLKEKFTDKTLIEIPTGTTLEEIRVRKKIIRDFYAVWNAANPTKQVYNTNLKEFINVRFLSIQETSLIAANKYSSTFALTHCFTEILELAQEVRRTPPKKDNNNQKRFTEIIVLEYKKKEFGMVKLTVGVLKGSKQHIQYCITAIE